MHRLDLKSEASFALFRKNKKQIKTAHTKRISCVIKILNDFPWYIWRLSNELAAILGEACYGSPWVCTSASTIVIYFCQFWNHSIMSGLPNMVCAWLIENLSSRTAVYSTWLFITFLAMVIHKAIPIKCFVSHRPPSREGGSVGRAKKKMNTWRVLRASEGRAAKYESLVTWSFRS